MEEKRINEIENTVTNTEQIDLYDIEVMTKQALVHDLSDEEIGMPDIEEEWRNIQARVQPSFEGEVSEEHKVISISRWKNIVAAIVGLIVISGFAYAVVKMTTSKPVNQQSEFVVINDTVSKQVIVPESQLPEEIVFDNTTLVNMLDTISKHYNMKVQFANDNLKGIRLYYTFITSRTIDKVIRDLNHFNKMTITRDDETIYVNPKNK